METKEIYLWTFTEYILVLYDSFVNFILFCNQFTYRRTTSSLIFFDNISTRIYLYFLTDETRNVRSSAMI